MFDYVTEPEYQSIPDRRSDESPLPAASSALSTQRQLATIVARLLSESGSADRHQLHQSHREQPHHQIRLEVPDQAAAEVPEEDELVADIGTDNEGEIRQWSRRIVGPSTSDGLPQSVVVDPASSLALSSAVVYDPRGSQLVPAGVGRRQRGTGAAKRGPGVCINSCLTGGMTFVRCKSMCHWYIILRFPVVFYLD